MARCTDRREAVDGLRVAIVNWRDPWHPEAGGAEAYAFQMARGLRRRGASVTFLTARAAGQSAADCHDDIEIVRIGSRFTVYPRVLGWLWRRRRRFDAVVDCQNGIPFFTPCVLPATVPVFCVMHHVHDAQFGVHFSPLLAAVGRLLEGRVARLVYRRKLCIAVSQSTADAMAERLGWTGAVRIIPNGLSPLVEVVEAPVVEATVVEATVVEPPAPPASITWVGRMVAHKRAELVLDVAARLAPAGVTIDVIGRGPASELLAAEIARRDLAGSVRLRGYLAEDDKRAAVAASVLHLNTSQGEGWGLCVLEAAQLGVPTVAYDVDGLRDAVRHGVTGWLVRTGERIEDVTQKAMAELADPVRRAEIAQACRAWAGQFEWDRSAGELAELIATAAGAALPAGDETATARAAWTGPTPAGRPDLALPATGESRRAAGTWQQAPPG
ncbi:MAG TPA: glycosyltransferase family 4 protein [Streptosporangiaceae bacterium]|nr:glycosyltransferase family 4 protein [Streptosporangiaceae bacterium]